MIDEVTMRSKVRQLLSLSEIEFATHGELLDAAQAGLDLAQRWHALARKATERSRDARMRADSCLRAAYKLRGKKA